MESHVPSTNFSSLPHELILSISKYLPDDISTTCFSLTNRRTYTLVPSATSRASLRFPQAFTGPRCSPSSAAEYHPARWAFLLHLERSSSHMPSRPLLCATCFMLHPVRDFTPHQASLPPEQRTCHPVTLRSLPGPDHVSIKLMVEACTCWRWTRARKLPEMKRYHSLTSESAWACSRLWPHACDHTCKKRMPPAAEPQLTIKMHLFEHPQSHAKAELTSYYWNLADHRRVFSCLSQLCCSRTPMMDGAPRAVTTPLGGWGGGYRFRGADMTCWSGECIPTGCSREPGQCGASERFSRTMRIWPNGGQYCKGPEGHFRRIRVFKEKVLAAVEE